MRAPMMIACVLALGGCLARPTFECAVPDECTSANGTGTCVDGLCAFTDTGCASGQRYGEHAGSQANECVPVTDVTVVCFGSGRYLVCIPETNGVVDLAGALDTTSDPRCLATQPVAWSTAGQPDSCIIGGTQLTVSAALTVTGSRPLVLAAGTITVDAPIDVASHIGAPIGPGANATACVAPSEATDSAPLGAGGAGGTFMTEGGDGGTGDNNGARPGGNAATADLAPPLLLRGGCAGGAGGDGIGLGGAAGAGGGAIFLAGTSITIASGVHINASGAGGSGNVNGAGGGGGGSGGMILLVANAITAVGVDLVANGGGGASGSDDNNGTGNPGLDPNPSNPTDRADGGTNPGGAGGAGFARGNDATDGQDNNNDAGGGGGGGAGYIQSNLALNGADISPTATIIP